MPRLVVDTPSRAAAARSPLSTQIRGAGLLRTLAAATFAAALTAAPLQSARADAPPEQFDSSACYQLVGEAGRMIALARWEEGVPQEKLREKQRRQDAPGWMTDLVDNWITDAFQWQATDELIHQLAMELDYAGQLPRVDQLTKHQTMNLWMQHIAHNCDQQV